MAQEEEKRPPPPPGAPEGSKKIAVLDSVEQQPITAGASGAGLHEEQRLEVAPLLQMPEGGSAGADVCNVPVGPRSILMHVVKDGSAEFVVATRGMGCSNSKSSSPPPRTKRMRKTKDGTKMQYGKPRPVRPSDYFDNVIQEEWANPGGGHPTAKHLYSLPEETMEDLKVVLVDALVVALHLRAVMPKDGGNNLKDAMDTKNDAALKKAHEAMSLAIRSAAALLNFTRATAIWADNLLQNSEVSLLVLRRTLQKMKRAAEFAADASQDNIQFCARAQAASIIVCRNIWLKHWKVDTLSKSNLATEKFSGRLLFGESNLDKVVVETR
ncbi:UNVERIFIED_CONTAM: hypothetical protein K2H54_054470 [Gekko kuhli]